VSYVEAAEELFRQFAQRHSLQIEKFEHEPTDLMMEVPAQLGLSFQITLCLSDDELSIGAGEHWGSWYLADNNVDERMKRFSRIADGLIDGNCRVIEYWQFGRPKKTVIEERFGDQWNPISTRYSTFLLPFFRRKRIVITNEKQVL
jgi:hypothetical protein